MAVRISQSIRQENRSWEFIRKITEKSQACICRWITRNQMLPDPRVKNKQSHLTQVNSGSYNMTTSNETAHRSKYWYQLDACNLWSGLHSKWIDFLLPKLLWKTLADNDTKIACYNYECGQYKTQFCQNSFPRVWTTALRQLDIKLSEEWDDLTYVGCSNWRITPTSILIGNASFSQSARNICWHFIEHWIEHLWQTDHQRDCLVSSVVDE